MSYDINLVDPITEEVLEVDDKHHIRGGTYAVGGTTELHLNITYNYSKYYYRVLDEKKGIRVIYGMTGADAIPLLQAAADKLGNDVDEGDYWASTEGNAKRALLGLIALAKLRPDGVFQGD